MRRGLSCVGTACDGGLSFVRTHQDAECPACGRVHIDHPHCANSDLPEAMRSSQFPQYVLHVLCDGTQARSGR